ncbi:hypothetical protein, partial [Burkholderia sp. 9777_1386]|uniref:hypothetical protein n=1 Tax=Burkholderia sp. 9777_1386 TaxID=2751183 RepID=UPI001E531EEB
MLSYLRLEKCSSKDNPRQWIAEWALNIKRLLDIINIGTEKSCSSFLEMSCSSHLEMSHLDLGKLAGSPSDHGADDAPNSSGDI